jgi:hypothetical protein
LRKRLKKKGREGEKEGLDKEEKEGLDKEGKERRGAGERRIPPALYSPSSPPTARPGPTSYNLHPEILF